MADGRGADVFLVGRREGNRSLERPSRRWEYAIKIDIQEI
jgi:hypothetical protein